MLDTKEQPARVWIADSSPLFRNGVRMLLSELDGSPELVEVDNISDLKNQVRNYSGTRPEIEGQNLMIVDRCLPGLKSFGELSALSKHLSSGVLIMAEVLDDMFVHRARSAGINAVIPKSASPEHFISSMKAAQVNNIVAANADRIT